MSRFLRIPRIPVTSVVRPQLARRLSLLSPRMSQHTGPFTVKVKGPHEEKEKESDHQESLLSQLKDIPKDASFLRIEDDTPSDTEWAILGSHFPSIRRLDMDTGFNEELNDRNMPLHWPLERLKIGSACGETIQTPFIRQAKINHLTLFLTCGLRFEGPTSDEMRRAHKEAIARGEAKAQYFTVGQGTPEERQIEVTCMPELAAQWLQEKYSASEPRLDPENLPPDERNLRTVEIIENDALETFGRMALALPHVVENLTMLNLRSTNGCDLRAMDETLVAGVLPQLMSLETLKLTIGEVLHKESSLGSLYTWFPPNLTKLYFRGPVSLCQSDQWGQWLEAFSSDSFLPKLTTLGFVLDLHYTRSGGESDRKKESRAPDELLHEARVACERLYETARRRGINIENVDDEWAGRHVILRPVDERWQ